MTVLPRVLAAFGALALGLGGALVVAAPASAATLTVTKNVDDGLPGSLSYELGQLDPGVVNTIDITVGGPITGPAAGFPTIFDDVVITSSATTRPVLVMKAAGGSLNVSGAALTMTGMDIVSDTPGSGQGISVLDGSLSMTNLSVRDFDIGVFYVDSAGGHSIDLTDVDVGGSSATSATMGVAIQDVDGDDSLTRVAVSYTNGVGILLGTSGGAVDLDTVSAEDGSGILLQVTDTTVTAAGVSTARTLDGLTVFLDASDLRLSDLTVTDTDDVGAIITATNGSTVTLATATITTSADSGIVLDAEDSSIDASDVTSHHNGPGAPGCGCPGGFGSGIEVFADNSTVTLTDAQSHDNDAQYGGGVYIDEVTGASTVNLTDVTADNNTATIDGGGIYLLAANSGSTITITRATVTDNTATENGGGLALGDIEDAGTAVTVTASTVTGNTSSASAGPSPVSGGGGLQIYGVRSGASMTVSSSTISGNTAADDGGGIQVVHVEDDGSSFTISDSTVSGNNAGDFGGGIQFLEIGDGATSTATASVVRTTIDGNRSSGYGAAVAVNDPAPHTGGEPTVLISRSTLSNNTTPAGGGGLYIGNSGAAGAVVQLLDSTVAANHAQGGGAVYSEGFQPSTTQVTSSTLANNTAHTSAGIEENNPSDTLLLENSILSGGLSDNASTPNDLSSSTIVTARYSLVQTPRTGVVLTGIGNITGADPKLGALAANGGTTKTMLLTPSSPAFNAGDPAITGAGQVDQRGQARVYQRLDMGAVEWQPALALTGQTLTPGPPLIAFLLLFTGLAMVAFSRLRSIV